MNKKRTAQISGLMLACVISAPLLAAAPQNSKALPTADSRQQLLDLENRWVEAEVKHDATTLRGILDDKFLYVGTRKASDKETFIKNITAGDVDPTESQTLTDRTVLLDGDTAVVIGTDTVRGTDNGTAFTAVYRYTVTYIYRNGRWIALAEHLVKVPEAK